MFNVELEVEVSGGGLALEQVVSDMGVKMRQGEASSSATLYHLTVPLIHWRDKMVLVVRTWCEEGGRPALLLTLRHSYRSHQGHLVHSLNHTSLQRQHQPHVNQDIVREMKSVRHVGGRMPLFFQRC